MTRKTGVLGLAVFSVLSVLSIPAKADLIDRRVAIASDVVANRMESAFVISDTVIAASHCIASMKVVKAGFTWGGEGSTGLVSCRTGSGWSAPSFFNTGGVNFGVQIGVEFLESVMMFMTPEGQTALEHGSVELGGELSFALGPIGGGPSAGVLPGAAVLVYNYAVGLYAGATVDGFVLTPGPERNGAVYGNGVSAADILNMPGSSAPATVQPFLQTLNQYFPPTP